VSHTPFAIWCVLVTIVVVTVAVVTDLLWRRIPNFLTIPAFVLAVVVRSVFQGWTGIGLAIAGAAAAPVLLLLLHGGKGIGMGDLKLMAAIGAMFGPMMAVVTVLLSAVVGGLIAILLMMRPGGQLADFLSVLSIGIPFIKKRKAEDAPTESQASTETMPYGLAIGAGSLLTLAVYWWTGNENWFLTFVKIAANR
jgi:prepilin peptidase CpaA